VYCALAWAVAAVSDAVPALATDAQAPAAPPLARASSQPPPPSRICGKSKADAAALCAVARNQELIVKPKASYRQYTFEDVCHVGQLLMDGKISFYEVKKKPDLYKVPVTTMQNWCTAVPAHGNKPKWLVERDVKRRTSLPKSGGTTGGSTVLGEAVEKKLMTEMADAACARCPYMFDEICDIMRDTAIELELVIPKTGTPYNKLTDVTALAAGFIRRCAQAGVHFLEKRGRKLGLQRLVNQNYSALKAYAAKVNPELRAFQKKHGIKILVKDVGNWDETGVDLCAFATTGLYLIMEHFGNLVVVPFEASPHITIIVGYVNGKRLFILVIIKGTEGKAPSAFHAQLLDEDDGIFLGQTPTGWVNNELKVAYFKINAEAGHFGSKPTVINVDGHGTNRNNDELTDLAEQHNVLLVIPPSHTSAAVDGMGTQQCDRPAHQGGPIACLKRRFRELLKKQFFAAVRSRKMQGKVSMAEVLKMLAVAWEESFKPELMERLNRDVGYYNDEEGILQWDITRILPPRFDSAAGAPAAAATATATLVPQASAPAAAAEHDAALAGAPVPAAPAPTVGDGAPGPSSAAGPIPTPGAALSLAPAPVRINFGGRAAVQESQGKQLAAIAQARADVDRIFALNRVLHEHNQPAVPRPTEPIYRDAATLGHTREGVVVGSAEHRAARKARATRKDDAAAKKSASMNRFWTNHRTSVRTAESALVEHGGDLSKLKVSELKALIISRTGGMPKSKNNFNGAMVDEARAVIQSVAKTIIPPTPPRAVPSEAAPAEEDVEMAAVEEAITCSFCGEESVPTCDERGNTFCSACDVRMEH